ncbi:MAG: signal peptidase II [Gammaproteobacteria bacterium]|nr:signal peptidase II [Gammaproteobacteria bacterium]
MKSSAIKWTWLSILIITFDQVTKYYISHQFSLYETLRIIPGLNITYLHNTGAAFSFLSDAGGWQRWLFIALSSIISVILLGWMKRHPATDLWLAIALALILGGAIGNLIDRVIFGYVIDFISVYYQDWYWPAFNVADSAISVGVVMLIIDSFWFDQAKVSTHSGDIEK